MIRYLKPGEIDIERWDDCVEKAENGNQYATSSWLNSWCRWHALVLNNYEAVMPLPMKQMGLIKISRQPLFTQQLGVFGLNVSPQVVGNFLAAVPHGWLGGIGRLHLYLNTANSVVHAPAFYQISERITHHIRLDLGLPAMNENALRSVKKAESFGLLAMPAYDIQQVLDFVIHHSEKIKTVNARQWGTYRKAVLSQHQLGRVEAWQIVNPDSELHAAAIFLRFLKTAVYSLGASSSAGRDKGGMPFLMHSFFQQCRRTKEVDIIDMAGSMQPGIARFFKSLGGVEVIYPAIRF